MFCAVERSQVVRMIREQRNLQAQLKHAHSSVNPKFSV